MTRAPYIAPAESDILLTRTDTTREGTDKVKNQYFGDVRDLFKYDLVLEIMRGVKRLNRFVFIPMLTPDDTRTDGGRTDYFRARAGTRNRDLLEHLQACVEGGRRDIREIEGFLASHGLEVSVYGDGLHPFSQHNRADYFARIDDRLLYSSLILLDPDIGLEVKDADEKHLMYAEVKQLYRRMRYNSALMIFQYLPRENRPTYVYRRCMELKGLTSDEPLHVSDNEIIFFFLTKNKALKGEISRVLDEYGRGYPDLLLG